MGQIYPMGLTVAQFAAKQLTGLLRAGKTLNALEKDEAFNCFESISLFNRNGDRQICIICKTQKQTGLALPFMPFCRAHLRVIIDASARTDVCPEDRFCQCGLCVGNGESKIPVWEGWCYSYLVGCL